MIKHRFAGLGAEHAQRSIKPRSLPRASTPIKSLHGRPSGSSVVQPWIRFLTRPWAAVALDPDTAARGSLLMAVNAGLMGLTWVSASSTAIQVSLLVAFAFWLTAWMASWLYAWVGRELLGEANLSSTVAAVAYSACPAVLASLAFRLGASDIGIVLALWTGYQGMVSLAAAHRFSWKKALGTVLLSGTMVGAAAVLVGFVLYVRIFHRL